MEIRKETIEAIIKSFNTEKDSFLVRKELLTKFNQADKEHVACLSYMKGVGGYYIPFLKYLTEKLKLENIVELGNQTGMSTVALYDAVKENPASHLYTIDIEKDQRFCPDEMFTSPQVDFIYGDVCSYTTLEKLPKKIDLLFTDTLHYDYQLQDEFEIYQHLLADTALIAIDDIRSNDKGKLFDDLKFSKWDLTELCHGSGWGLILFERKNIISADEQTQALRTSVMKVWERKYYRLEKIIQEKDNTLWKQVKNLLKKIHPVYKLYTRTFNYLHHKFFKKKVLFYKR